LQPTKEVIDAIFREKVRWARRMSLEEKFLAGPELFAMACQVTRAGIRHQHPDADEDQVHKILRERLALGRRLREAR